DHPAHVLDLVLALRVKAATCQATRPARYLGPLNTACPATFISRVNACDMRRCSLNHGGEGYATANLRHVRGRATAAQDDPVVRQPGQRTGAPYHEAAMAAWSPIGGRWGKHHQWACRDGQACQQRQVTRAAAPPIA